MNDQDNLLFYIADALGMTLHLMDGVYRASEKLKFKIGPWVVEDRVVACSVAMEKSQVGFLVKIMGNAWMYIVSREDKMMAYVFDGQPLKLSAASMGGFGEKTVATTLAKIIPVLKGTYLFDSTTHAWRTFNAADLGQGAKA